MDSSQTMGAFPEIWNFKWLFLKLNQFTCNYVAVGFLPVHCFRQNEEFTVSHTDHNWNSGTLTKGIWHTCGNCMKHNKTKKSVWKKETMCIAIPSLSPTLNIELNIKF